ncbi:MAG: cobyrinate a,c-diamide synthase, partial [Thermodesulfobacteriota bacterium]
AGVIFNNVASERHREILVEAVEKGLRVRVFGYLPRDERLVLPSRHLGLVIGEDISASKWRGFLRGVAGVIEDNIDVDGLVKIARSEAKRFRKAHKGKKPKATAAVKGAPVRIAVARDRAFCFYYEDNFDILRELGAELVFFSPLKDKRLPSGVSGIYFGGGYPELNAEKLSVNIKLRSELKDWAREGLPIFAECGGMQYLGKRLVDISGKSFDMAGVFPFSTKMMKKRVSLGYRLVKPSVECPFLRRGTIRGHEYHYSKLTGRAASVKRVYDLADGDGASEGFLYKQTLASYVHLSFRSNVGFARGFIRACREYGSQD